MMNEENLLKVIRVLNQELYYTALGSQTSDARVLRELLENPRPGDLVVEVSAGLPAGLGRLIVVRDELVPFAGDPGGYADKFWYVETPGGELARWSNCLFLRVLDLAVWELRRHGDSDNSAWVSEALKRHNLEIKEFPGVTNG